MCYGSGNHGRICRQVRRSLGSRFRRNQIRSMRFWIDDLRNPREYVQDWGKDDDIWSKSYEEFMMHLQIHVQGDHRIGHIYFDYNLGTGGTGLDCAMFVTSEDWKWVLDCHSSWSSHSSDRYGRAKIIDLMDKWREQSNLV